VTRGTAGVYFVTYFFFVCLFPLVRDSTRGCYCVCVSGECPQAIARGLLDHFGEEKGGRKGGEGENREGGRKERKGKGGGKRKGGVRNIPC
jgi:hypothetical protein